MDTKQTLVMLWTRGCFVVSVEKRKRRNWYKDLCFCQRYNEFKAGDNQGPSQSSEQHVSKLDTKSQKEANSEYVSRLPDLAPKWVRLAPKGTNPGNFQIRFSTFWRTAPKCTESDLKISRICPIWGQSDPL